MVFLKCSGTARCILPARLSNDMGRTAVLLYTVMRAICLPSVDPLCWCEWSAVWS